MNHSFIGNENAEMPRTEEANQRLREEQRAKILDGARKVFARKGIAATMAEVAAAAEVSQGLAYRYFANKEAIFKALLEQVMQAARAGMPRILEMPGTPGERLEFLISRAWNGRREYPELYQLMYQMLSDEATPVNLRELVDKQGQTYQDVVRQLIVEGQATGEVAEGDPDQLVTVILVCLDGLSRWALREPEQFKKNFPDAGIILRIFKPHSDQK
jgi:AcrR family transcriptional regulator